MGPRFVLLSSHCNSYGWGMFNALERRNRHEKCQLKFAVYYTACSEEKNKIKFISY
jgi:hypothetical protein